MNPWHKHYTLSIALHVLFVAIVGSAVATVRSIRPAYETMDVLVIVAVGMIAGILYLASVNRLWKVMRAQ